MCVLRPVIFVSRVNQWSGCSTSPGASNATIRTSNDARLGVENARDREACLVLHHWQNRGVRCLGRIRSIDGAIDPCARDFYNDARLGQKFRDNRAHNRGGLLGEIANLRLAAGKTGKNTFHTEKQLLLTISALACGTL